MIEDRLPLSRLDRRNKSELPSWSRRSVPEHLVESHLESMSGTLFWLGGPAAGRQPEPYLDAPLSAEGRITKTLVYVITLQGVAGALDTNSRRYDYFRSNWTAHCQGGDLSFRRCSGEINHDVRGLGLTRSFVRCLDQAVQDTAEEDGVAHSEAMTIFLEDDARPFDTQLCHKSTRNDIWNSVPEDAFVLLLGGHTFTNKTETCDRKFIFIDQSYGSYGFAVSQANIPTLRRRWLYDADHPLAAASGMIVSPDLSWFDEAKNQGKRIYATQPLTVWHEEGFSNTWNRTRGAIGRPKN